MTDEVDRSYVTFKRSSTYEKGWGRRLFVGRRLSYDEAQRACDNFNDNRNARQIRNGTKMEFTHAKYL